VTVNYEAGPGRTTREFDVVPASALSTTGAQPGRGLQGEYFDNPRLEGQPRLTRTDARMDFRWTLNSPARGIPFDWYSVRWTGTITAPASGIRTIGVEGNDGYRLYVDDVVVIDNWRKRSYDTRTAAVNLAAGSTHRIKLEFFETTGVARVKLIWNAGVTDTSRAAIDAAVAAARRSDVAVIVAGVEEGEFRDRAMLGLPGRQPELIDAVAATGKPVVVVLIGGSAITMPWLPRASAVLDAWYPGEAGGDAVADVIFGDANPAGRLPITFPVSEGQLPLSYNHKPTGRGDDYVDLTGMALFPFGYGLSYSTFEYSSLAIDPEAGIAAAGTATIRFTVKNVSTARGRRGRATLCSRSAGLSGAAGNGAERVPARAPEAGRAARALVHAGAGTAADARRRYEMGRRARCVSHHDRQFVEGHSAEGAAQCSSSVLIRAPRA
jgi:beta-glucosidase